MKIILLAVSFFVLQTNLCVTSNSILNYLTSKMHELSNTISNSLKNLRNKFKFFLFPELKADKVLERRSYDFSTKTNKAFCDFVEEEAAQRETESPEYASLRSEPTALMSTSQLATFHGKRIESHVVLTKDGFLLTLHRIRRPFLIMKEEENIIGNCTVLMHHGLLGSSADWILLGPDKSLPYILSNGGCDVWLTNARGNYYSRGHVSKKIDSSDFWDFSFQEMGLYDLPAVTDYIKKVKKNSNPINYIGHSMGATTFLVMLSSFPDYNNLFRISIFLAPLVYMTNTEGPLKILTTMAESPPEQLLKLLGAGEFVPKRKIPAWIANKYCKGPELYCHNPLLFLSGGTTLEQYLDKSLIARILYHVPAGGSTKTILHFAQMIKSGKFHKYNNENGEFPLRHVTVPIAMISSTQDVLATMPDVLRLYFSIINPIDHYVIRDKNLSHTDFLWSPDADNLIYKKVVEFLINGVTFNVLETNEVM